MGRKANRLKNRLRIERERADKVQRDVDRERRKFANESAAFAAERRDLNRSVALRMRVQRDFDRPHGSMWALNIVMFPYEFRLDFGRNDRLRSASYYAAMKGDEAGKQIARVIERCIAGELAEFEAAK